MLFDYPVYSASLVSERRIINSDHIEQIKPHANVPVDPGAVDTECCEFFFYSGTSCVVLLNYDVVKVGLKAYLGIINDAGEMT